MKVPLVPRGGGDLSMRQDEVVIIILRAIGRGRGPNHGKANAGAACVQGRRCHRAVGVFWSCRMLRVPVGVREHVAHGAQVVHHARRDPLIALLAILCTVAAESCHNVRDARLTYRKTKKDKRECRRTSGRGSKIRSQVERLKHVGARRGTADCLCQKPARTGCGRKSCGFREC